MDDELDLLRQAISLLEKVARAALASRDDNALCEITTEAETAGRLIDSLRVQAAGEIDERSRFELGSAGLAFHYGHRRSVHFIEQLTRVSQAEATRRIRLGAAVRPRTMLDGLPLPAHYPVVAEARETRPRAVLRSVRSVA